MQHDASKPFLTTQWTKVRRYFKEWRWRFVATLYLVCAVFFYIWMFRGTEFSAQILLWAAPVLVLIILRILVDTHLKFAEFVEPDNVDAKQCVRRLFDTLQKIARRKHSEEQPILIDVLGVALHHSHEWIENDLEGFMREFPHVSVELRITFVAPNVLETFDLDPNPRDWAKESRERVQWVTDKLLPRVQHSHNRLRVHVRTIQNLPHWHGILVDRRYLFLGRVSWSDGTERHPHHRPKHLTCAENDYRCFSDDDRHHGDERVSLFRRWMAHYLYGKHQGETLLDTISPHYNHLVQPIYPR